MARGTKDKRKGFDKYVANKIKDRDDCGPSPERKGDMTMLNKEKSEVLNHFCALVFNGKFSNHTTQVKKGKCRDWEDENAEPPRRIRFETIQATSCLNSLKYVHQSIRANEIHLCILRELADEFTKLLPIIFEKSWQSGKFLDDWKKMEM